MLNGMIGFALLALAPVVMVLLGVAYVLRALGA